MVRKPLSLRRLHELLDAQPEARTTLPVAVEPSPARVCGEVLLVEDSAVNQLLAIEMLEVLGVVVETAETGLEALERLQAKRYDLVLMDVQMPEMDGLEATRRIRAGQHAGAEPTRLPIIAMTANAMRGDRERCLAAGMDDYLSKPVDFEALRKCMQRWLPADVAAV